MYQRKLLFSLVSPSLKYKILQNGFSMVSKTHLVESKKIESKIDPFQLERYFAKYEFDTKYLMSTSDPEPVTLKELLKIADPEVKQMWNNLSLGYTESLGHPMLRKEVAMHFYDHATPDNLLIVTPEEGIFLAMQTLLEKGDDVIVTYPGYQSLYSIAESIGARVTKWVVNATKSDDWDFDIHTLRQIILKNPNTKLIVFNFPHNPTGFLPSRAQFEEILNIAKEHGVYVLSDEMYRFLEYTPDTDRLESAADMYQNALSLFGMSKTFGLPGLRIGWVYTHNTDWMKQMIEYKDYTTICSSAPSEILAIMGCRQNEQLIQRTLNIVKSNIILLEDFMTQYSHIFEWKKPKVGTICFPRLLVDNITISMFCDDVRQKVKVLLLPATTYGYEGKYFRVGFGRKNFPQALNELSKYMQNHFPDLIKRNKIKSMKQK